jgi:hypothetical protein
MHTIGVDEAREIRRATDAADHQNLMRFQAEFEQRSLKGGKYGEIPATRAPIGVDLTLVRVLG